MNSIYVGIFAHLDVSISRFGTRGLHAQGEQCIVLLDKRKSLLNGVTELVFLQDKVVTRSYHDIDIVALILMSHRLDVCDSVCDARSGVSARWLTKHLIGLHIGNLLQHHVAIQHVGHDQHVLNWHQRTKSVYRHLQQTAPCTKEVKELLWFVVSAERPKAATDTSSHNYTIIVLFHVIIILGYTQYQQPAKLRLFLHIYKFSIHFFQKK